MVKDCTVSKEIWERTIHSRSILGFYSSPLQDWLLNCLRFGRKKFGGWLAEKDGHYCMVFIEMEEGGVWEGLHAFATPTGFH